MKTQKVLSFAVFALATLSFSSAFADGQHSRPQSREEQQLVQRINVAPVQTFNPRNDIKLTAVAPTTVQGSRASASVDDVTGVSGDVGGGSVGPIDISVAGGAGGDGGQGGQSSSDANSTASSSAVSEGSEATITDSGNSTATLAGSGNGTGEAAITDSGNGGGANVATTNINKFLNFVPVQVAPLPPSIPSGGVNLTKSGDCGPRVIIRPFERTSARPLGFGAWNKKVPVETAHGMLVGFDFEDDYIIVTTDLPAPFYQRIVRVYGHQLYITAGQDGQGGGSSSALNRVIDDRGAGGGASLSAGSAFGVVGYLAVPCEYEVLKASTAPVVEASSVDAPVTPTLGLNTERVRVLATTGRQVLERIPAGPPLCAGEPIPEGFRCGFVRDRVEVVKEVDLEEDGK